MKIFFGLKNLSLALQSLFLLLSLPACQSNPDPRDHLGRSGNLNQLCQLALKSNQGKEDLWLEVLGQIHLYSSELLSKEIESANPALLISLWSLPDHQLRSKTLKRLSEFDYEALLIRADRLVKADNNRFGGFLLYLASCLLSQDREDQKILLILAQKFSTGYLAPLLSASASSIYRNIFYSLP